MSRSELDITYKPYEMKTEPRIVQQCLGKFVVVLPRVIV